MTLKLYKTLSAIAALLLAPLFAYRLIVGKENSTRFKERLGIPSIAKRPAGKLIWAHAASVGETLSVLPLLEALAKDRRFGRTGSAGRAGGTILLTTTTQGSVRLLESRGLPKGVIHQFCPIENLFTIRTFLGFWQPNLALFVESEFWPHIFDETSKRCRIISVNTKISDRSSRRWKWFPNLLKSMLRKVHWFFPQSTGDLKTLHALGFNNAEHVGNLKYASPLPSFDQKKLAAAAALLEGRDVVAFVSTHEGEEKMAVEIYKSLRNDGGRDELSEGDRSKLLFVLIPRHLERIDSILAMLQAEGIKFAKRSSGEAVDRSTDFYVVGTMGEVNLFCSLSPITVMGGSFTESVGGHNIIEPARFGSVVIAGPHTHGLRGVVQDFKSFDAGLFVAGKHECIETIRKLRDDKRLLESYRRNAKALLSSKADVVSQLKEFVIEQVANPSSKTDSN